MNDNVLYDNQVLMQIKLFEKITKARVKDCFSYKEKLIFVVYPGDARKAVGKGGETMKRVEQRLGKRLKIVEYNKDKITFVKNLILPFKMNVSEEGGIVMITGDDKKSKGLIIGAKAQNLRNTERIVQHYFPDVKEIKVV